mgnify:FL=1
MLVTINNLVSGTCAWCCQKSDDAVDATFKDGLKGVFCKKHFWDATKARADQQHHAPKSEPTVKGAQ